MNAVVTDYLCILRARWRLVAGGALLGLGAAVVLLLLVPPTYRSSATLFIRTPGDISLVVDGGDSYAQNRARTYAQLARSSDFAERVVDYGSIDMLPDQFAQNVSVSARPGTVLIDLTVTASTATEAERAADAAVSVLSQSVRALEAVPESLVPRAELVVIDSPDTPAHAFAWGVPVAWVLLGATAAGALLGALGAVLRSIFDRSVRDPRDAARICGLPVLGTIGSRRSGSVADDAGMLWRRLRTALGDNDSGVIAICEPSTGTAAIEVALALAAAMYGRGHSVILVDLDLGSGNLTRLTGDPGRPGVADVLLGRASVATVVFEGPHGPLLTTGDTRGLPIGLVDRQALSDLVSELRIRYEWVVLLCSPLRTAVATTDVADGSDAFVMAVRFGTTTEDELREAGSLVPPVPVTGIVGLHAATGRAGSSGHARWASREGAGVSR